MHGPDTGPEGHPQRWAILGILCTCLVLVVASVSSLNIAIPTIQRELDASQTQLQWIVDAYALVFAGLLLPAGALGDRYGRKWTLLGGLALFGTASVVASGAGSANQLVGLRALMGVGAALIMPSTLSLLASVFPMAERPRAIAIWAGFAGAGGAIGVVASGALLERFWWGSVFFIAVPIVVAAMIAIAAIVPNSRDEGRIPLDPVGSALSMGGLVALVFAIIEGPEFGWTHPVVLGSFTLSVAALVAFVVWEGWITHPILDPRYFGLAPFRIGALTITVSFFAMFAMFFSLSQLLQFVRGYSPLATGVATLPFAVALILVAPRGPRLAQRITIRLTIALGLALIAAGLLTLAAAGHSGPYPVIAVGIVLMACGAGLSNPSATSSIMASLPMSKAGVGSAVNDTTREVGGAVGIALVGSVIASVYRASLGSAPDALPEGLREAARDNVGAAVSAGQQALGEDPDGLRRYLDTVGAAFGDGMRAGMTVSGVLALAGAALVLRWYPRGTRFGIETSAAAQPSR